MLSLVLLAVLGEQLVPLLLKSSALRGLLVVKVVNLLGDSKALVGVEAKLLLELLQVISLQRGAVDSVSSLLSGAKSNDGPELDQGRLVLDLLALLDGSLNAFQVVVAVLDDLDVPTVRLVALGNILSESLVGVTIDGNVVVVPDGNQVSELKVTSQRAGLARDTLHQATIAEEAVCIVVNQVETVLVKCSSSVCLCHGQTDGVADTLTKGTGCDLNAGSVVGLGVTGCDAVDLLHYWLLSVRRSFGVFF